MTCQESHLATLTANDVVSGLMCRCTVAAAVEGRDHITILHCSASGKLAQQQELQLPGVTLPTQVCAITSALLTIKTKTLSSMVKTVG